MINNNPSTMNKWITIIFKDIENGVYGERIKELFMKEESSK